VAQRIELGGKYAVGDHHYALVDDADFTWLNAWRWHAKRGRRTYYARRVDYSTGRKAQVFMHREILGMGKQDLLQVDHTDHNGLNNQRHNLRKVTQRENANNPLLIEITGTCEQCGKKFAMVRPAKGMPTRFCSAPCTQLAGRSADSRVGRKVAARVLDHLSGHMTAKEIAAACGIHVVSVWRVLPSLVKAKRICLISGRKGDGREFIYSSS